MICLDLVLFSFLYVDVFIEFWMVIDVFDVVIWVLENEEVLDEVC